MRKTIFTNLIVIFTIIFSVEFFLRFFEIVGLQGYNEKFFSQKDGIVFNQPNSLLKVAGKLAKTDTDGFRIPINNYTTKKNNKTIHVLGDSVSFGFGIKEKDSFAGLLRKKISSNISNHSVIGHNLVSYHYILDKNKKNTIKNSDEVVIFLCLNDIYLEQGIIKRNQLDQVSYEENYFISILKNERFIKINVFLREKSALFVFLKSIGTNGVERHFKYTEKKYEDEDLLNIYAKYISKINQISKKKNIKVKFVLLPYAFQVVNRCSKEHMKPQNILREIFQKSDLELYDFTEDFCRNSEGKNLFLGHDPVHLSNTGHELVTRLIIENKIIN